MSRTTSKFLLTQLATFKTQIGWFAVLHDGPTLCGFDGFSDDQYFWQDLFVDYALGKRVSFSEVKINDVGRTEFQGRVLRKCRQLPYGSTMAYGELATKSGYPNAARAVGSTMKSNRFPIIIPCHRVVASTGVGGFSGLNGTSTKKRLLAIEGYFDE